jgi:hypothetical protein
MCGGRAVSSAAAFLRAQDPSVGLTKPDISNERNEEKGEHTAKRTHADGLVRAGVDVLIVCHQGTHPVVQTGQLPDTLVRVRVPNLT